MTIPADAAQDASFRGIGAPDAAAARPSTAILAVQPPVKPFKVFDCDGEAKASVLSTQVDLTPEVALRLIVQDSPGYSKHALVGSEALVGTVGIKFKPNISASGTCRVQTRFDIPVGG